MPRVATIQLGTSEPRRGYWCTSCSLPSVVEFDIHHLCPEHASHPIATIRYCPDCVQWDFTKAGDQ